MLPSASPQIMAGVRQSLSIGLILMVISEMFASSSGLGFTIVQFQRSFAIPEMWSGIVVLGLLGVGMSFIFQWCRAAHPALVPRPERGRKCSLTVRPARRRPRRHGDATLLSVAGLKKVLPDRRRRGGGRARTCTFDLRAGELACLVGPSGSGKTTLLKCISGLMAPTEGEVLLDGKRVSGPPKKMAVVFQEYGRSLFPWMRVAGQRGAAAEKPGRPEGRT